MNYINQKEKSQMKKLPRNKHLEIVRQTTLKN